MPAPPAEFAPAKVNLALHVTGQRPDGYHLLDSLVIFPRIGDEVSASPAQGLTLTVEGPFADAIAGDADNLVLRAARLMNGPGAALRLAKNLPVAAGVGGGSADAAATLRVLARLWGRPLPGPRDLLRLGADVPVCLLGRPARVSGIGEVLVPVDLPPFWLVLANPGLPLPTAEVFGRLHRRDGPPLGPIPALADASTLAAWLALQRNDLQEPAQEMAPVIGRALSALAAAPGCLLARMSGSGATCFGIFAAEGPARSAVAAIREPGWWVAAAPGA